MLTLGSSAVLSTFGKVQRGMVLRFRKRSGSSYQLLPLPLRLLRDLMKNQRQLLINALLIKGNKWMHCLKVGGLGRKKNIIWSSQSFCEQSRQVLFPGGESWPYAVSAASVCCSSAFSRHRTTQGTSLWHQAEGWGLEPKRAECESGCPVEMTLFSSI